MVRPLFLSPFRCNCSSVASLLQSVTLHTDLGDLKIELNCELVPKACEVRFYTVREGLKLAADPRFFLQNFLALCASGYYNDCLFHRYTINIRFFLDGIE